MQHYSFIKARPKPLLQVNTRIWLGFISAAISVLVLFFVFLNMRISDMEEKRAFFTAEHDLVVEEIEKIDRRMEYMEKQKAFFEEVASSNMLLKDSIKNLFELIPDQITLTKVEMEKDQLVLKGIAPSKEVYSFLLAVPLKSIFAISDAEFYMMPNSWYNFVSVNKLEEEVEVE